MTFGEKLYQLRKGRSMSQEALAGELGVSRQAISRWELGEVLPDTASVLAVSRLFGVSTDYLLLSDCTSEAETPAARAGEQSLRQRQEAVGKGVLSESSGWLRPLSTISIAWGPGNQYLSGTCWGCRFWSPRCCAARTTDTSKRESPGGI